MPHRSFALAWIPTWIAVCTLVGAAALAPSASHADSGSELAGTYSPNLPDRAEIMNLHADGTAEITLSDQVTAGAGGFTFSDSFGSWRKDGPRRVTARFLNLNFDVTTPAATYSGMAVVNYVLLFAPNLKSFAASCSGKIFAPGTDPFAASSVPVTTFDCAYLDGFPYRRMPLPALP